MKISIDTRLKKNIESLHIYKQGLEGECYSVKFTDIDDTFWFYDYYMLQEFLNKQTNERYFDKSLRKGFFEYTNENNDKIIYKIIKVNRGNLTLET